MNHFSRRKISALLEIVLLALILFYLSACTITPKVTSMVPPREGLTFQNTDKTITVRIVLGGEETDPWLEGVSKIDHTRFREALLKTLANSNLFRMINPKEGSDYYLDVLLLSQSQQGTGLMNMKVDLLVRYTLVKPVDESAIWEKDILSSYTATLGSAFAGGIRLRKANEGAVRENFKILLNDLAGLSL